VAVHILAADIVSVTLIITSVCKYSSCHLNCHVGVHILLAGMVSVTLTITLVCKCKNCHVNYHVVVHFLVSLKMLREKPLYSNWKPLISLHF
jgi:hypothetical protein